MQILICPECRSKVISLGEPDDAYTCDHCDHTFQYEEDDDDEIIVSADMTVRCNCDCPHCGADNEVLDKVRESLGSHLSAENIDVEVRCEDCKKIFYVGSVSY